MDKCRCGELLTDSGYGLLCLACGRDYDYLGEDTTENGLPREGEDAEHEDEQR